MIVVYYIPVDAEMEFVWPDPATQPAEVWSVYDTARGQYAAAFDDTGVDLTGLTVVTDTVMIDKLRALGAPV